MAKTKKTKKIPLPEKFECHHSQVENIGTIVPNKILKPIGGKIYWHIDENYLSQDMEKYKIVYAFSQTFVKWKPYMGDITFEATGDINQAQIVIKFMTNGMQGLPIPFDTGVLAYTYAPNAESFGLYADMFINDAYKWDDMLRQDSILLFNVVLHEIGHSFNLGHSTDQADIMYPYYNPSPNVVITKDTQRGLYNLYKAYGVTNPDASPSNGGGGNQKTLSLTDLFASKSDVARLSLRQVTVLANFLDVTINSNDKFQTIVNKVYTKISS